MSPTTKSVLIKYGKWAGAGVIAAAVTLLASPDVLNIIPTAFTFVVPTIVIPALIELDRKVFGKTPVVPTPAPVPVTPVAPVAPEVPTVPLS